MLIQPVARIPAHKLRTARAYVDSHIAGDLRVDALAQAVGMSTFHFAHAFRQATGVSPHRYVMAMRIERAKAMLRETTLTLDEIAQRIGYSSQSHFSVAFHKAVGVAPSAFRKRPEAKVNSQVFERGFERSRTAPA